MGIGRELVKHAVRAWLGARKAEAERNAELVDLVAVSVRDTMHLRKLVRRLEDIGDHVVDRLKPLYEREFRDVPEYERRAALHTLVDTLAAADLSDRALFDADADPIKLARAVRAKVPDAAERALLGDGATALYNAALDDACMALVRIVQQLPAFQARADAELLSRTSQIIDTLDRLPRTTLDAPSGRQHDHEFRRRYLELISDDLDELELFGVDVRRYRLRTRLTVAYLSLTVTGDNLTRRGRRHLPDDRWFTDRGSHGAPASVRVEDALTDRPRTLLRGEAGSGKTTLLQWLAVNCARGSFTGGLAGWNGRTPFLIRLRRYPDGALPRPEQFLDHIAGTLAGIMPPAWVHRQLDDSALLLVDGVDELAPRQRQKVRGWLRELVRTYPALPIVVTSRPSAASQSWLTDLDFESVLLESMGPADVTAFCARWHAAVREAGQQDALSLPCGEAELTDYETALLRHLDGRRHLRTLASNPLLCAMLCALNLDRRKQLPPNRMALYEAALTLLVERRDIEREIPATHDVQLDTSSKLAILQRLAWNLSFAGRTELPLTETEAHIETALRYLPGVSADARDVTQYLLDRSGIIRKPTESRIDFIHRTFQEYLAAKHAIDEHQIELLAQRAHSDQWRETIIMAAGHATANQREQLLTAILDRAEAEPARARRLRVLAAACLETARSVEPSTTARIDAALCTIMPPRSRREARSLSLGGDRTLRNLPTSLDDLSEPAAAACVRTAALINGPAALKLLAGYAQNPRHEVQKELAEVWRYFDVEEYAKTVLAHAPLCDGRITVRRSEHVRHASKLHHLTQLWVQLFGEKINDLKFLDGAPFLKYLWVTPETPLELRRLTAHQDLGSIQIWGAGVTSGLGSLAELPHLKSLVLQLHEADSISFVAFLSKLDCLVLRGLQKVSDLSPLTTPQDLRYLALRGLKTSPEVVLGTMDGISQLGLGEVPLRRGLANIEHMLPRLIRLEISYCNELSTVDELSSADLLQTLTLLGCPVADISVLAGLYRLEHIDLDSTRVTNIRPLARLPKLRSLDLRNCPSELDLSPLSELPRRAEVWLSRGQQVRGLDEARKRVRIKWA